MILRGLQSTEKLAEIVAREADDPTSASEEDLLDAAKRLRDQERELSRYRAAFSTPEEAERVSEVLPKTADGVLVVPGMEVWPSRQLSDEAGGVVVIGIYDRNTGLVGHSLEAHEMGWSLYADPEAAREAAEERSN